MTEVVIDSNKEGHWDDDPVEEVKQVRFQVQEEDSGDPASSRPDHLRQLLLQKRASVRYINQISSPDKEEPSTDSLIDVLTESNKEKLQEESAFVKHMYEVFGDLVKYAADYMTVVEVRLQDFYYHVKVDPFSKKIQTVYNQSIVYGIVKFFKRMWKGEKKANVETKAVLENINLVLKPGKMYLVLGPPASGKSTLLKAIAGRLSFSAGETTEGAVLYNGLSLQDKAELYIENAISFIGQLDDHAPRLTVQETFEFAFQCKSGGTHLPKEYIKSDAAREYVAKLDAEKARVVLIMEGLGLSHVANTFVGNSEVRGVSGGQRRRVTVGEMFQSRTPIMCGDEISTGLDAASTFDIVSILSHFTRAMKMTRIISLLQPSPETVSLFDEVILLAEGRILYAGPVEAVEAYFASLGYKAPKQCDVADFLQLISTPDGAMLYDASQDVVSSRSTPYSLKELAEAFQASKRYNEIRQAQQEPWEDHWEARASKSMSKASVMASIKGKYANSVWRSVWLNLYRNLIIWIRDKRFLVANLVKNVIMGISVGAVFYQTDSVVSIYGVLFQLMLFIMLGAMVAVPEQVSDRIIYYKHAEANFYGPFSYVIGMALALVPQTLMDVMIFGTIIYFMVGLAATAKNFFIFIAVLFVFALVMNQMLSIFAAFAKTKAQVQAASAGVLLFNLLFCGFIVLPTVVPDYYIWIYWWNPMAWAYRAALVNEFRSSDWGSIVDGSNVTSGELALNSYGQTLNGEPFGQEWVVYAFAYLLPYTVLCTFVAGLCLKYIRADTAGGTASAASTENIRDSQVDEAEPVAPEEEISIPFQPVTLTFENVCYDVKASKGKGQLRLLNNVSGVFRSGRMCALMGSSGAGKTTLMDVIALRKTSGTVTGDIRLNGFEQEAKAFRRCSGYVEQFDVQATELTVRETVLFSARLRLNSEDPAVADDKTKQKYVDQVLRTLELEPLADAVVGVDGQGGLSFEQKKRLSIAVELAASPSIVFLDEPTSGLDARAALIVVKVLRRIADTGRTIIATIHQPSLAVFEMFNDLLLLKKGGRTVFFGELGEGCGNLIHYFESRGAAQIDHGENPANWMLTVITTETDETDFAEEFVQSPEYGSLMEMLRDAADSRDPSMEVAYTNEFAAPQKRRNRLLNERMRTIYWRSPAYNLTRMLISLVIAFLLGSVFITNRDPDAFTEQEMTSLMGTIFISFIITGVLAITSVLPVMLEIRDSFYRQRAAGMADHKSLAIALGVAEKWFIVVSSALFCAVFIPMIGSKSSFSRKFAFWGFFTFNIAIYSYFGQAFTCLVRGMSTAQILASCFIGLNNFFSGLVVRPQYMTGFFQITYWITPGHYVYEGLVTTLYEDDSRPVVASMGSEFYQDLVDNEICTEGEECSGTVSEFVYYFFGGRYKLDHAVRNAIVLGVYLVVARASTLFALKYFNYTAT